MLWLRTTLDVGYAELLRLLAAALLARDPEREARAFAALFPGRHVAAAPSVRALFDALLKSLALRPGAAIACSAVNIAQMEDIVRRNGLRAVAVDVEPGTFYPTADDITAAIREHDCVAYLHAHYFGACDTRSATRADLRGALSIDDRAQCFHGRDSGAPLWADVTLFSFGPYKSPTAAGGGFAVFASAERAAAVARVLATYPRESSWRQVRRVLALARARLAGSRPALALAGPERGDALARQIRAIAAIDDVEAPEALARNVSAATLACMTAVIRRVSAARWRRRRRHARAILDALGASVRSPAARSAHHSHWLIPVLADAPDELLAELRAAGFDAARMAKTRPIGAGSAPAAAAALGGLILLPSDARMGRAARRRMIAIVLRHAAAQANVSSSRSTSSAMPMPESLTAER